MSSQPTFSSECVQAFNSMNTQESLNDYFVCGFEGSTNNMVLFESGKGGMARVKEVLKESFSDKTAVAIFRVTAVDDRENTVSYRTKLIHVIYIGPQTPVMKRAKIASFNAAFKQPFSSNLSMQTDDVDGDLNEAAIEKSLRASGGAHQPTRFDFDNLSAPGEKIVRTSKSPSHNTADSPAPERSFEQSADVDAVKSEKQAEESYPSTEEVMLKHNGAFDSKDVHVIAADYASGAQLFHTDANTKRTTVYNGQSQIAEFFKFFIESAGNNEFNIFKNEINGNVVNSEFENKAAGYHYGFEVFYVMNGKIQMQAITTVSGSAEETVEPVINEETTEPGVQINEETDEQVEQAHEEPDEEPEQEEAEQTESAPVQEEEEQAEAAGEEVHHGGEETFEEEAREQAGEYAQEEDEAPKDEVDEESFQKLEESEAHE